MTQWHLKSKRKASGGLRTSLRRCDKKLAWKGRDPANTKLIKGGKEKRKKVKGRGNTTKVKLLEAAYAQVVIEGKSEKIPLTNVLVNDANRQFARTLIITKGAICEGMRGKEKILLKVTNRPGQTGIVQARLLKKEEEDELANKIAEKKKKSQKKKEKTEESTIKKKENVQEAKAEKE